MSPPLHQVGFAVPDLMPEYERAGFGLSPAEPIDLYIVYEPLTGGPQMRLELFQDQSIPEAGEYRRRVPTDAGEVLIVSTGGARVGYWLRGDVLYSIVVINRGPDEETDLLIARIADVVAATPTS